MRVLLTGRPKDRDRVRPELLAAGIEIVAESDAAPGAAAALSSVDAIVTATDASHNGRAFSPGEDVAAGDHYRESLTPREQEVLTLLAEGLSNKAMAQVLGISDQTVKFHVAAIIGKLGATNRTDAVRRAIRRGLVAI
jgi:two-component system, NarL family, nitrate/nitrite response regulator NarL